LAVQPKKFLFENV